VKTAPSVIVRDNDLFDFLYLFFSISWWAQVTENPDDNRRIVFIKGILIGLKEVIEFGGQVCPNSKVGEILLWKNAQKKEIKNSTSEAMNRIIPVFRPFITMGEWDPCVFLSRWISRHHVKAIIITMASDIRINVEFFLLISSNVDIISDIAYQEVIIGQGLCSTKWNGLNFFVII